MNVTRLLPCYLSTFCLYAYCLCIIKWTEWCVNRYVGNRFCGSFTSFGSHRKYYDVIIMCATLSPSAFQLPTYSIGTSDRQRMTIENSKRVYLCECVLCVLIDAKYILLTKKTLDNRHTTSYSLM